MLENCVVVTSFDCIQVLVRALKKTQKLSVMHAGATHALNCAARSLLDEASAECGIPSSLSFLSCGCCCCCNCCGFAVHRLLNAVCGAFMLPFSQAPLLSARDRTSSCSGLYREFHLTSSGSCALSVHIDHLRKTHHIDRKFPRCPHSTCDVSFVELDVRILSHFNRTFLLLRGAVTDRKGCTSILRAKR